MVGILFSAVLLCSYVRCGGAMGVEFFIVLDHSNTAFGLVWKTRTLLVSKQQMMTDDV